MHVNWPRPLGSAQPPERSQSVDRTRSGEPVAASTPSDSPAPPQAGIFKAPEETPRGGFFGSLQARPSRVSWPVLQAPKPRGSGFPGSSLGPHRLDGHHGGGVSHQSPGGSWSRTLNFSFTGGSAACFLSFLLERGRWSSSALPCQSPEDVCGPFQPVA